MDVIAQWLERAPDDPLLLLGWFLAAWLPVCAVGLGVLATLAWAQDRLTQRRRARPALALPPAEVRPLVVRRYVTNRLQGNVLLALARVGLAIGAVAVLSALIVLSGAPVLLALR